MSDAGSTFSRIPQLVLPALRSLFSLPPTINPFEYAEDFISRIRFPTVPAVTYNLLIVFSLFHIFAIMVCLVILLLLAFPKKTEHIAKFGWFFKKIYVVDEYGYSVDSTPLILPNSGPWMACFQLMASSAAQIAIYFTYFSFKSFKFASKFSCPVGLYIFWLFGFYGIWTMAWAGVYTRLYTQKTYAEAIRSTRRYIFRPLILNCFFVIVPIIVTFVDGILIYWQIDGFREEREYWRQEIDAIKLAASAWDDLSKTTNGTLTLLSVLSASGNTTDVAKIKLQNQIRPLLIAGSRLLDADLELIRRGRVIAFVWSFILLATSLIYGGSMWSLISLIRGAAKQTTRGRSKVQIGLVRQKTDGHSNDSLARNIQEARLVRRGVRYLLSHSLITMFTILYSASVCFVMGFRAEEIILDAKWRGLGSWLSLISVIFITMGMSFQFWRMWVDLDIIIPVQDVGAAPGEILPSPQSSPSIAMTAKVSQEPPRYSSYTSRN